MCSAGAGWHVAPRRAAPGADVVPTALQEARGTPCGAARPARAQLATRLAVTCLAWPFAPWLLAFTKRLVWPRQRFVKRRGWLDAGRAVGSVRAAVRPGARDKQAGGAGHSIGCEGPTSTTVSRPAPAMRCTLSRSGGGRQRGDGLPQAGGPPPRFRATLGWRALRGRRYRRSRGPRGRLPGSRRGRLLVWAWPRPHNGHPLSIKVSCAPAESARCSRSPPWPHPHSSLPNSPGRRRRRTASTRRWQRGE